MMLTAEILCRDNILLLVPLQRATFSFQGSRIHKLTFITQIHVETSLTGIQFIFYILSLEHNQNNTGEMGPKCCSCSFFHVAKNFKALIVQALWLTLVILALWEAEEGGSQQGQEFKTSLANMVKPRLY